MASPRFVHDAVVVAAPGVTPCHQTAGPAQKPIPPASPLARSPTAPAGFLGMPIGQDCEQEDLRLEDNCCTGVPGACQHGPGAAEPFRWLRSLNPLRPYAKSPKAGGEVNRLVRPRVSADSSGTPNG